MKKIAIKIGRMLYMGIMILASITLTFKTVTIPSMYAVANHMEGVGGFNTLLVIGVLSIVIAGVLFYAITSAIYSAVVYISERDVHKAMDVFIAGMRM